MKRLFLSLFCFASLCAAQGQTKPAPADFKDPMRIPIVLSANCFELRPHHFHGGIDIKTQGVIGKGIYSVADGYVVRVAVSPGGYGKALYIRHPNGTTSVYGHVEQFYDELEAHVYEQQYAQRSFRVDLSFAPDRFPVTQGQLVALSGNRGSSGGPHLHFEIRDGAGRPLNILAHGFMTVADTIPPRPSAIYYVQLDSVQGVPVHRLGKRIPLRRTASGSYAPAAGDTVEIGAQGYFAVEATEYKNGTQNAMGLYRIEAAYDGETVFGLEADRVPFDVTRFVNALILYSQKERRNQTYRLYVLPNNPLSIYRNVRNRGMIAPPDNRPRPVEIRMEDEAGNQSRVAFTAVRRVMPSLPAPEGMPAAWWKEFAYDRDGLKVFIPARALYESIFFRASVRDVPIPSYAYSPLYEVHTDEEPLQSSVTISIAADSLPAALRGKALLGRVSPAGKRSAAGGGWTRGGFVETKTREFGTYYIAVDTIVPRIVPEFRNGDSMAGQGSLSVKVTDDFSGVETWSAQLDGRWALFEYDPKNDRLTHVFDDIRWETGCKHNLTLHVADAKGNRATFTASYFR